MSLPYNEDAERTVILKLFLDPRQVALVAGKLAPEDFYVDDYRDVFRAMVGLSTAQKPINLVSVKEQVGRDVEIPLELLSEAHSGSVEDYIAIILDNVERRRAIDVADRIKAIAYRHGSRVVPEVHDELAGLVRGTDPGGLSSPSASVDQYLRVLESRRAGERGGLSYGIGSLDDTLQPAAAGDLIIIAARPSVGKTTMAEVIADHWAGQANGAILFASLEMSIDQLYNRMLSRYSDIEAQKIIRGHLSDVEFALAKETAEARRSVGIWYLDDGFATTAGVRAAAARVKMLSGGLDGIVVDYLQLLQDAGDFEVQRVTKISRTLKAIAREFECPVIALSQLSRAVEMRTDKHPRLYDLRESGSLEQDADVVLGLYRELGEPLMDVEILKNRNGPSTRLSVYFDSAHVSFGKRDRYEESESTWARIAHAEEEPELEF